MSYDTRVVEKGVGVVAFSDGVGAEANGKFYEDAVAYAIVKNQRGRVKAYKENIYHQMKNHRFIASHTDKAKYILGALNGQPAKQVYQKILNITEQEISTMFQRYFP